MNPSRIVAVALGAIILNAVAPDPFTLNPITPGGSGRPAFAADAPKNPPIRVERAGNGEPVIVHQGEASFYGGEFHGRKTASGEPMNQNKPTAASRTLPLGTKATVTNQENGKSVDVIVNDRGPYVGGRVIDLSTSAARKLDMIEDGTAPVRVEAKPSEQPNEAVKEKVETKAEQTAKAGTGTASRATRAGGSDSDKMTQSGSGK